MLPLKCGGIKDISISFSDFFLTSVVSSCSFFDDLKFFDNFEEEIPLNEA
jgi:hypothetical protein